MINHILLRNFKCHRKLDLDLKNLTLMSGYNAGGKTSSIQGVALIAQALRTAPRSRNITLNGPLTRLGKIGDVITEGSEKDSRLIIGVGADGASLKWNIVPVDEQDETHSAVIAEVEFESEKKKISSKINSKTNLLDLLPSNIHNKESKSIIDKLARLSIITSLREPNQEIFATPDIGSPLPGHVGTRGEFAPWWLSRRAYEDVPEGRMCASDSSPVTRRQVNAWGAELFPGFEADCAELSKTGLIQLHFRTQITDNFRRPANVGYGLTYAFPILVACLTAEVGQTIFIDTPEAHLHPRAQSKMGRFLSVMAASGVQIIVETHSDHVLNGIRVAVKDGVIASASVGVNFFSQHTERDGIDDALTSSNSTPIVLQAEIDKKGRLSSWPLGFFDQIENDLALL